MKLKSIFILLVTMIVLGCSTTNKVKDGRTAYRYKQYSKAVELLQKEYQKTDRKEEKANIAYLIADSYTYLNKYQNANEWYKKSELNKFSIRALLGLAKTYQNLEQYELAINAYEKSLKALPGDQSIRQAIFAAKQASDWKEEMGDNYSTRKLLDRGNQANYSPAFYEGQYIVFTSDNAQATGSDIYAWTGHKKSDLFIVDKNGNYDIRKFDSFINSKNNDGTAVFTMDFNRMIFTRCFHQETIGDDYCKLMESSRINGVWTEPKVLPFVKDGVNYGQPALIENDSVLVFSSIGEAEADGYDLWYSIYDEGRWTTPYPMPSSINTQGNEYFPTSDGDTLYFSSDYLPGMGGLDIFKTHLNEDGTWTSPVNLKPPFNSGADDFGLIIDRNIPKRNDVLLKGYLTSTRSYEGYEDIYVTEIYRTKVIDEVPNEEKPLDEEEEFSLYLAGKVMKYVYNIEDDPNSGVKTKASIRSPQVKVLDKTGNRVDISGNNRGLFIGDIKLGETYTISVKKEGFLNNTITLDVNEINIPSDVESYTVNIEVILEEIFKGQEIILDNIYYDFDQASIREDAQPTLDELAEKLILNPQINIELASHTDCRGEVDYNQDLSQRRAESAVIYLISKGAKSSQLSAKGYGESQLIDNCDCDTCTEEQHQVNRRTSFKIL